MSHANLTARYRPQTFADLAGQDTVRTILSRAAAEDRVAPAYLFSGTRGVGKTTLARVFAKALNCIHAPAPEPCNECERCRQITAGTAVDVVEIDGASNRGIDDVRRLKEVVGYAPMDGRYKVFIIDEAHMLSRDAFNALLKTLEEPPARVTFIMATTESHKFPATILSRCQHFVFKRLPEVELEAHLTKVLSRESLPFDEGAVRLLTRRAAGSVRDAMSLMGQVLALGGERLTEADTRSVLGLAGQELLFRLFGLLRAGDTPAISMLVREMLDSGLDLGFFLRELAVAWRNLFMLCQAGEAAVPALDLPAAETTRWLEEARGFDLAHVHAAWQMTIDGQRRVLTSLEPALALELMLLNLALLPRLLSLENISSLGRMQVKNADGPPPVPSSAPVRSANTGTLQTTPAEKKTITSEMPVTVPPWDVGMPDGPVALQETGPQQVVRETAIVVPRDEEVSVDDMACDDMPLPPPVDDDMPFDALADAELPSTDEAVTIIPSNSKSWEGFLLFCKGKDGLPPGFLPFLNKQKGLWQPGQLILTPSDNFAVSRLEQQDIRVMLCGLLSEYYAERIELCVLASVALAQSPDELKKEVAAHPGVRLVQEQLNARLLDYGPYRK